jgi:hypothetical protein
MAPHPDPRPTLILNPADDDTFRRSAEQLVEDGIDVPAILEEALRRRWPSALVRPRELAGERLPVWYVYRDGHWVRPGG